MGGFYSTPRFPRLPIVRKEQKWRDLLQLRKRLNETVAELEKLFPNRKFTPDGHLAGSIGEVIAAYIFDLDLLEDSAERHDAKTKKTGTHVQKYVQIKFTQRNKMVAISSEPEHLIVLRLPPEPEHDIEIVYNGPGAKPWQKAGKLQKNGQRQISLSCLREINKDVPDKDRLLEERSIKLT